MVAQTPSDRLAKLPHSNHASKGSLSKAIARIHVKLLLLCEEPGEPRLTLSQSVQHSAVQRMAAIKEHAWRGKVRMYLSKRSEMADIDFTGLLVPQVFERLPLSLKRTVKGYCGGLYRHLRATYILRT